MACVDVSKKKTLWRQTFSDFQARPCDFATYETGKLLVSYRRGSLRAVDLKTGETFWESDLPGVSDPQVLCLKDQLVAVGSHDGSITAYSFPQ